MKAKNFVYPFWVASNIPGAFFPVALPDPWREFSPPASRATASGQHLQFSFLRREQSNCLLPFFVCLVKFGIL